MSRAWKNAFFRIMAILFLLLGIISAAIPFVQGWVFIVLGIAFYLCSLAEEKRDKIYNSLEKNKQIGRYAKKIHEKHDNIIKKYKWLR